MTHMRSLEDVRKLLGPDGDGLTDEQVAEIRARAYESAMAFYQEYQRMLREGEAIPGQRDEVRV